MFSITPVPCLKDNYAYLVRGDGFCAVVDPSEAGPVEAALKGDRLTHILNTHHHSDHVGGNLALKERFRATVIGPEKDRHRIPGMDEGVVEGSRVSLGTITAAVLEIPAHTSGHVAYWFEKQETVFTGDTLFAMGSGRLFEGDAPTMYKSLSRLAALPDETRIYCGHEYTQSNGRFALTLEPGNTALQARMAEVNALRDAGRGTMPTQMRLEKETNPFLRTASAEVRATLAMQDATDVDVFAEIRRRKNSF